MIELIQTLIETRLQFAAAPLGENGWRIEVPLTNVTVATLNDLTQFLTEKNHSAAITVDGLAILVKE